MVLLEINSDSDLNMARKSKKLNRQSHLARE